MTIPLQFASLYNGQEVFVWSDCLLGLGTNFLVGNIVFVWDELYLAVGQHFQDLYSFLELCCEGPWFKSIQKMDVIGKRVSCILELREILMSFQTGFSLVNAAVICAFLESISGLEPSSVITEPRYLKHVTVSSFCPFTLISVLMPLMLFVISLVFPALISMP